MTLTSKKTTGFTLIELLVVMSIAGTLVALVGGLAVDSYQKFQRKAEILNAEQIFQSAANQAFLLEKNAEVKVSIDSVQFTRDKTILYSEHFSYLQFTPVSLILTSTGDYSISSLAYRTGNKSRELQLNE